MEIASRFSSGMRSYVEGGGKGLRSGEGSGAHPVTNPKILILGSAQALLPYWASAFPQSHWHLTVENELANLTRCLEERPDLLVIDIELPEPEMLNLIRNLRTEAVIPILLLVSGGADNYMIDAYEAGVDDFIQKPIKCPLLRARIKAWLRHTWSRHAGFLAPLSVGRG